MPVRQVEPQLLSLVQLPPSLKWGAQLCIGTVRCCAAYGEPCVCCSEVPLPRAQNPNSGSAGRHPSLVH